MNQRIAFGCSQLSSCNLSGETFLERFRSIHKIACDRFSYFSSLSLGSASGFDCRRDFNLNLLALFLAAQSTVNSFIARDIIAWQFSRHER